MPLPLPPNSISLGQIQTQFGGAAPTQINEYYAGGSFVAAGTRGLYGAIPSSGTIDLADFYGAPIQAYLRSSHLVRASLSGYSAGASTANAGIILNNAGVARGRASKTVSNFGSLQVDTSSPANPVTSLFVDFLTSTSAVQYPVNEWSISGATVSGYSVRATWNPVAPSFTLAPASSATGSWLALGTTTRSWFLESVGTGSGGDDKEGNLVLQLAFTADTTQILYTSTIQLFAYTAP